MESLGWTLIPYDWYLYKKRGLGQSHGQRQDHVRTEGKDNHLQASDATNPADTSILDFQPPGRGENRFLLFMPAQPVVFYYGSPSKVI